MDKIIKTRKRVALRHILIVNAITLVIALVLSLDGLNQVFRLFKYRNAPIVTTLEELNTALETSGVARYTAPYLDDGGYEYGTETKTEYILTYTQLENNYLLVVQKGEASADAFYDEPRTITLTKNRNSYMTPVYAKTITDFSEAQNMSTEEANQYFYQDLLNHEVLIPHQKNMLVFGALIAGIGVIISLIISRKSLNDLNKRFTSEQMDQLHEEINNPLFETSDYYITENYLINKKVNNFKTQFIELDSIGWAYLQVTQHRVNFIPTSKSYTAMIRCFNGVRATVTSGESNVRVLLNHLLELRPLIVVGYHKSMESAWKKATSLTDFREQIGLTNPNDAFDNDSTQE